MTSLMLGARRRSPKGRPWAAWLAASAAAVTVLVTAVGVLPAAAATPEPAPTFGLRPAAEGQTPLPGGHFEYSVRAGSTITDAVVVENLTGQPLPLQVFAADLVPLQGGGFGVSEYGQPTHSVGAWTSLSASTVTLGPWQQRAVDFTVRVPKGLLSGDYGGAVVAENPPSAGKGISVQFRVALQVLIDVTGATPRLEAVVGPLSKHKSGHSTVFTATLTNTGNESFRFAGTLELRRGGRELNVEMTPTKDYLFPGEKLTLTARWAKTPIWGSAHAQASVVATPGLGASRTFRDRTISMRFFPWWLIVMAVLALLLLLFALYQAWRNRKQLRRRMVLAWRRRQAVRRFKGQIEELLEDGGPAEEALQLEEAGGAGQDARR